MRAFSDQQIESVTIPEGVTEIKRAAFANNNLKELIIPNSVVTIEPYAFQSNQLTYIQIGSQLQNYFSAGFTNNPLETIKVNENNLHFYDIDGKGMYNADGTVLVVGTRSGEIAANTIEIGDFAFQGRGVTSIHIPSQVKSIRRFAFDNNALVELIIPPSVTYIGRDTFSHNQLEKLKLGENVEEIGLSAFYNNRLTSIEIPNSVTSIQGQAFGLNLLTHVKIGINVNINGLLFDQNPLKHVELFPGNPSFRVEGDGKFIYHGDHLVIGTTSGDILEGTTRIGWMAFSGRGLETVTIPDSVDYIESQAFRNNKLKLVSIPDGVRVIEGLAFGDNPNVVLRGTCGTEAETYALNNNLPFLSNCHPLVVQFDPDSSDGENVKHAMTKVTVYSYDNLETKQIL